MRKLLFLSILCGGLSGCGFAKWAVQGDPDRPDQPAPIVQIVKETVQEGLSDMERGGLLAGIAGAIFTLVKSTGRAYATYQAKAKAAITPTP